MNPLCKLITSQYVLLINFANKKSEIVEHQKNKG
jgi:hypothetical protein